MEHTLIVITENSPGVLHRLSAIFTRRKVNIENISVVEIQQREAARITIVINHDRDQINKIVGQINKIIEVLEVNVYASEELTYREMALLKFENSSENPQTLENIALQAGAKFNLESNLENKNKITIEKTGTQDEIDDLYSKLEPYSITEFIRSGRVALLRN